MKITIILGTMIHGGAHRVACIQANELAERGYDVTLLLVVGALQFPYELSSRVKVEHALPAENLEFSNIKSKIKRKLLAPFYLVSKLKKIKPDLVISHIQSTNREAILSCWFLNIPIIACEHTSFNMPYGLKGKFAYIDRRFIYKLANEVTVLTTSDIDNFYVKYLKNVSVMKNPGTFESELLITQEQRRKAVLAVGDLNRIHVKGWDNLIEIFSQISTKHPGWILQFAGSGEQGKNKLIELARNKDVENSVQFLGAVSDVKKLLQNSSVFILTSRNEGLPMALIEAMSQGCACIAFDCKTGPSDIITNNIDGVLVEDQNLDQMSEKLNCLLSDENKRRVLSEKAVISSKQFSKNKIIDEWDSLINKVLSRQNNERKNQL